MVRCLTWKHLLDFGGEKRSCICFRDLPLVLPSSFSAPRCSPLSIILSPLRRSSLDVPLLPAPVPLPPYHPVGDAGAGCHYTSPWRSSSIFLSRSSSSGCTGPFGCSYIPLPSLPGQYVGGVSSASDHHRVRQAHCMTPPTLHVLTRRRHPGYPMCLPLRAVMADVPARYHQCGS